MVEKTQSSGFWPSLYEPFRTFSTRLAEWVAPASEAKEADSKYQISMELPGVSDKDIDLQVHDGVITVKGEKISSREEKGDTWYFSERQYGSFSRSFRLPPDADESAVTADLKDGVLTITVGKKADTSAEGARKVEISKT